MTNEQPIKINGSEVYDVSSMYPTVEIKTPAKEVFNEIYNHAYNDAINDVLEKLKREVSQHHKFGIEGFKVGICHSRILIEGMKRE